MAEIRATKVVWKEDIPAYIIAVTPRGITQEERRVQHTLQAALNAAYDNMTGFVIKIVFMNHNIYLKEAPKEF